MKKPHKPRQGLAPAFGFHLYSDDAVAIERIAAARRVPKSYILREMISKALKAEYKHVLGAV